MSLLQISKVPTAENSAIHLHPADNIAVARVPLAPGADLRIDGVSVKVLEQYPGRPQNRREADCRRRERGAIRPGDGTGSRCNRSGRTRSHSQRWLRGAFVSIRISVRRSRKPLRFRGTFPHFSGISVRMAGRARATTSLSSPPVTAPPIPPSRSRRAIRSRTLPPGVHGVVAFPHGEGCAHTIGPDTEQLRRTLAGVLDHPNVRWSDHPGSGLRNEPDRSLSGCRMRPNQAGWSD